MKIRKLMVNLTVIATVLASCAAQMTGETAGNNTKQELLDIIHQVNGYWQTQNPQPGWAFWNDAAYHTGNMEAYFLTKNESYKKYSEAWAEHNQWMGAKSNDKAAWKYQRRS